MATQTRTFTAANRRGYTRKKTIRYRFNDKHKNYIRECENCTINVAEGAVRAGKTIDNVYAFAHELKTTPDRIHLATGSTMANAKLNIGDANGYGLEWFFRGQSRWGKYRDNECLYICGPDTGYKTKIIIFAGSYKADSYKKIRGNSFGMWIATEINLHHESFIREAFNRQLAAKRRKIFWDLNPSAPGAAIYEQYIDRFPEQFGEKYNYEHFTIRDNQTISPERMEEIIKQYEPGSIWYERDIEGKRSIGEGLIYAGLATAIATGDPVYSVDKAAMVDFAKKGLFQQIIVGVDFGGNGSGHAFVATGQTVGGEWLVVLRSERYVENKRDQETGEKFTNIDPVKLSDLFLRFVRRVQADYGTVAKVYADSAEQVLIRGLRNALIQANMGDIKVVDALKSSITNRIFAATSLGAQKRLKYVREDTRTWQDAISAAIWDPKKTELERLDNGTSDIDTLDAFEYTYERQMKYLLKARETK